MRKVSEILSCFVLAVLLLTSCRGKGNNHITADGQLEGHLTLSGAFALYPLAVAWADAFQAAHPRVRIDLSAGGAGKGITDALSGVVDIGMVSRELEAGEVAQGATAIAVAKDAVVATVNAANPNLPALLRHGLSRSTAEALWTTEGMTWGQVAGNGSRTPVTVYSRSDACGAAGTWAQWFGKKQEDLGGTAVYGDPGVAQAVQKDVNGIGFNNIGYAYDMRTGRPTKGIIVLPLDVNGNGRLESSEKFYATRRQLAEAIAAGRYPTPPARNLYLVTKGRPHDVVVRAFLKFILTEGQRAVVPQGYIRLDSSAVRESLEKVEPERDMKQQGQKENAVVRLAVSEKAKIE
jgi:phosphate transport system substrate-binding protein